MRKVVPESASEREKGITMLVDSCIRDLDSIGVRKGRKSCAARPREEWRHAVSKFRRAVSMKITIEDRKRCNIAADVKRWKTVSKRRGADETKSLGLHSV